MPRRCLREVGCPNQNHTHLGFKSCALIFSYKIHLLKKRPTQGREKNQAHSETGLIT